LVHFLTQVGRTQALPAEYVTTPQSEQCGRFRRDLVRAASRIGAEISAGLRNLGADMGKRWEMGCPWDNYPIWGQELGCTGSLNILIRGRISSAPKISSSSLPRFADWTTPLTSTFKMQIQNWNISGRCLST
jgi:hypothetical protein